MLFIHLREMCFLDCLPAQPLLLLARSSSMNRSGSGSSSGNSSKSGCDSGGGSSGGGAAVVAAEAVAAAVAAAAAGSGSATSNGSWLVPVDPAKCPGRLPLKLQGRGSGAAMHYYFNGGQRTRHLSGSAVIQQRQRQPHASPLPCLGGRSSSQIARQSSAWEVEAQARSHASPLAGRPKLKLDSTPVLCPAWEAEAQARWSTGSRAELSGSYGQRGGAERQLRAAGRS